MRQIQITTDAEKQMLDITAELQHLVQQEGWRSGILTVFVSHTTAALTINENADPDVQHDILSHVQKLVPQDPRFHHMEGNSDAHILVSFFGSSEQIIVENGKLALGTWQGIYFCEFDGPRKRNVCVKFIGE